MAQGISQLVGVQSKPGRRYQPTRQAACHTWGGGGGGGILEQKHRYGPCPVEDLQQPGEHLVKSRTPQTWKLPEEGSVGLQEPGTADGITRRSATGVKQGREETQELCAESSLIRELFSKDRSPKPE